MSQFGKKGAVVVILNPESGAQRIDGAAFLGVRADPGFAQPVLVSREGGQLLVDPRAYVLSEALAILYDPKSHVLDMDGPFRQWMLDNPQWPENASAMIEEAREGMRRQRLERRRASRQRRGGKS